MTLTKAELVDLLVGKVGLNKREARDMVDAFFEEISAALEKGNGVKLSNFGNFDLREKPQRPGRNPKTGELVPISARRVVTFHASAKLKTAVESAPRQYPPPNPCTPAFSEATMSSTETTYCYHCGRHHPRREMRQIETKNGKKWRCIQSIQATKKSTEQRDTFGKSVTAINTSENQARVKSRLNLERLLAGR